MDYRYKEKDLKDYLTTEALVHSFKSQFDLVAQAVRIAENMVRTGRSVRVKTDVQNPAYNVLQEVLNDYTDVPEFDEEEEEEEDEEIVTV